MKFFNLDADIRNAYIKENKLRPGELIVGYNFNCSDYVEFIIYDMITNTYYPMRTNPKLFKKIVDIINSYEDRK